MNSENGRSNQPARDGDPLTVGQSVTVYEEFRCADALIAAVRDPDDPDRWVQSTLAVPVEE